MKRASATLLAGTLGALVASQALAQASTPDGDVGQTAPPASSTSTGGAPATSDDVIKEQAKLTEIFKAKEAASKADEAASKAKQAAIEAEKAAKAAKDGTVTGQTAIQGTIQVGEGPKAEALLLASRGAMSAARIVRADLEPVFRQEAYKDRPVLLATSPSQLSSLTLTAFDVRRQTLTRQLNAAHARFAALEQTSSPDRLIRAPQAREGTDRSVLAAAAAVSQGLDVASKLASYFKADYTFGQLTVKTAPDLYANAIVRSFRDSDVHPKFYATTHMTSGQVAGLVADLGVLQDAYALAAQDHAFALKAAADLRAAAAEDKPRAGKLLTAAAGYEAFAAGAGKLLEATDGFLTALFAETAEKPAPIVQVAKEREIQRLVAANGLVLMVSGEPAAAYFTKRSLWTSIVGAPLYTMGGANVVYSLYDAASGFVVTDGVVPVHGGYMNVRKVQRMFPAP